MSDPTAPVIQDASSRGRRRGRLAVLLLVLPVVLVLGVRGMIAWQTTPQALVNRLEAELNARVEIGASELSLFRLPARVDLRDVRIAARDSAADNAQSLGQRPALERPLLSAKSLRFEGSPWALLTRKLDISNLDIADAGANIRVRENGSVNIDKLFKKPDIVNGKPNPKKKAKDAANAGGTGAGASEDVEEEIDVEDVPLAASIKRLAFSGNQIQAFIKSNGTLIDISGLRLEVSDLDVDPANLAAHNTGNVRITGVVRMTQPERALDYATLHVSGVGTVRPFDAATRKFEPLVLAKITFDQASEVSFMPVMGKMNKKLEVLKQFGINLGSKLGKSMAFGAQTTFDIEYRAGVIKTLSPLPAKAKKIDLVLDSGATLSTGNNQHQMRVILRADPEFSAHVREQVNKKANIIPAGEARTAFLAEIDASFFPGGVFQPICLSSGDIGDPDVEIENKLPDITKFLKGLLDELGLDPAAQKDLEESAGKLLEGLLKGR